MSEKLKKIAVFASGGGTDFQSVIDANKKEPFCDIAFLIASRAGIGAMERAEKEGIERRVYSSKDFSSLDELYSELEVLLKGAGVEYIVLAGWLKIIPKSFVEAFGDRIINIHPSLIPAFCGAGYYGLKVHEAVIEYGAKISGCTVHFVDETPDGGAIIAQRAVEVLPSDTPEGLQKRILEEEHKLLPWCVRKLCEGKIEKTGRKVLIKD
ncbi:MAG: phosphoribosylglycinamide formyltransferase [Clostridia bacterium]|nr:phosphoribosylglycinamide formyltransferase [Clostridia bacterium]